MKREIIQTSDGSSSIYLPELDETYHSTHGSIQEAEHVFIESGLKELEKKGLETVSIFEMGFGTGLNAFLTKIRSKASIEYVGIEAFPIGEHEWKGMNYIDQLGSEFEKDYDRIHTTPWEEEVMIDSNFTLKKIQQRIENYSIDSAKYDLIYFDAFGPRAQSDMWKLGILQKMYHGLKSGGALVTYCAKGQFKRDLKSLGFEVESLPGPPGKREMTRAWKRE